MAEKRSLPPREPNQEASGVRPGGYQSRGVPGEEAAIRSRMRVSELNDRGKYVRKSYPTKGGLTAQSTSAGSLEAGDTAPTGTPGTERAVYVLARKEKEMLETPVFHAGASGEHEAVVVFTDRQKAILYLQVAGWGETHEPMALSPGDLGQWLEESLAQGADRLAVDPDRQEQTQGKPQTVLLLQEQVDKSGESLYREVASLGKP